MEMEVLDARDAPPSVACTKIAKRAQAVDRMDIDATILCSDRIMGH
jgi:hypothetical protein